MKKNESNRFLPLNIVTFVSSTDITKIDIESLTLEVVGEKAYGLSCLPSQWTLPFIVISHELLEEFRGAHNSHKSLLLNEWANTLTEAASSVGISGQVPIIVRSSAIEEGLEERGRFYSEIGNLADIDRPLKNCLEKLDADYDIGKLKVPLIIQKYALPISSKGHLSNERRFYKESRDWIGGFEEPKTSYEKDQFKPNLSDSSLLFRCHACNSNEFS